MCKVRLKPDGTDVQGPAEAERHRLALRRRLAFNAGVSNISRDPSSAIARPSRPPRGCRSGSWSESCRRRPRRQSRAPTIVPGIALIGCGGMGRGDAKSASRFGDVVAVCDVDENHAASAAQAVRGPEQDPGAVHGLPQGARAQGRRHHRPRHAGSLAHADQPRRRRRRQGHLRGEAAHAHHRRGQAAGQGGAEATSRAADRHAAAQQQAVPARVRARAQRPDRQAHAGRPSSCRPAFAPARSHQSPVPAGFHWDIWLGPAPKVDYLAERATRRSAGGSTTPAARSPTGARITTTSPDGRSAWTVRARSRRGRSPSRFPAATPRRRSSRRRSPGATA